MQTEKTSYDKQARDFLKKPGYNITITKRNFRESVLVDKAGCKIGKRSHYWVTITRIYKDNSKNLVKGRYSPTFFEFEFIDSVHNYEKKQNPSDYSILACLTKYDPINHENFCREYGYDPDSIKGLEIYKAVKEEWEKVSGFFSVEELNELRDIN